MPKTIPPSTDPSPEPGRVEEHIEHHKITTTAAPEEGKSRWFGRRTKKTGVTERKKMDDKTKSTWMLAIATVVLIGSILYLLLKPDRSHDSSILADLKAGLTNISLNINSNSVSQAMAIESIRSSTEASIGNNSNRISRLEADIAVIREIAARGPRRVSYTNDNVAVTNLPEDTQVQIKIEYPQTLQPGAIYDEIIKRLERLEEKEKAESNVPPAVTPLLPAATPVVSPQAAAPQKVPAVEAPMLAGAPILPGSFSDGPFVWTQSISPPYKEKDGEFFYAVVTAERIHKFRRGDHPVFYSLKLRAPNGAETNRVTYAAMNIITKLDRDSGRRFSRYEGQPKEYRDFVTEVANITTEWVSRDALLSKWNVRFHSAHLAGAK